MNNSFTLNQKSIRSITFVLVNFKKYKVYMRIRYFCTLCQKRISQKKLRTARNVH